MTDRKISEISPSLRRRLRKKHAEPLNLPSSPSDSETESNESDDDDPLPDPEIGTVTVKEAIEGLFSSKTVQSTPHESVPIIIIIITILYICDFRLILVKRYSHGKSFRQRLAYVVYKHPKTSKSIICKSCVLTLSTSYSLYSRFV